MLFRTDGFDANGIVDQTDLVALSVVFVETLNARARKGWTLEAKIKSAADGAIFYFTFPAMVWLALVLSMASQTGLFISEMHITNCTGHPTRSQHGCWYFYAHFRRVDFLL
jgi:hypothetical protein